MKTSDPYLLLPELQIDLHGIKFPLELLYRHTLVTGQPGSGKSRLVLMPLLRSILATTGNHPDKKAAMVIIDPKLELTGFLQSLTREFGREGDLVIFRPGTAWYNPLASPFLTESEAVEKIIVYGNNTNRNGSGQGVNEAFWSNAQRSLLGSLASSCRALHHDLTYPLLNQVFQEVNALRDSASVTDWLQGRDLPASALQGIKEFLKLPSESTRPCVATSVANVLSPWKAEPLLTMITPNDALPTIDPFKLIHEGKILVIGCASAAFGVSITPLLLALKEHIFTSLLARDQVEIEVGNDWKPINQERPCFVVCDEMQTVLSPDSTSGELMVLDRLRSSRAGFIGVTQNLASLHSVLRDSSHATRLISLFANQFYLSNLCPYTSHQASWLMGTRTKKVIQYSNESRMAPPLLTGRRPVGSTECRRKSGVVVPQQVPRVDASTLAKMQTGEFWLRLANGKVVKGKARS